MKYRSKDLKESIAHLRALLLENTLEPQQKEAVERAIGRLKALRRDPQPGKADIFRCVREVIETLLRAFGR